MWETSKSILLSRTVWVAFGGAVLAVANILGYQFADWQVTQAIDLILFVLAAVFRMAATKELHVIPPANNSQTPPDNSANDLNRAERLRGELR